MKKEQYLAKFTSCVASSLDHIRVDARYTVMDSGELTISHTDANGVFEALVKVPFTIASEGRELGALLSVGIVQKTDAAIVSSTFLFESGETVFFGKDDFESAIMAELATA